VHDFVVTCSESVEGILWCIPWIVVLVLSI